MREGAVTWRAVGAEVVALDLERSTYLGVNRTGAVVWPLLARGATRAELVDVIVARFDVDREQAAGDLADFLGGLASRGLIERIEPS